MNSEFNYLQECFKIFPQLTKVMFGREYDMAEIENKLSHVKEKDCLEKGDLQEIAEAKEWDFKKFWPDFTNVLVIDKPIKGIFASSREEKKRTISALFKRFLHIEVVSVILRFVDPQNYAIISPPVERFLSLQPRKNHVDYYISYLNLLKKTSKHFQMPKRIADIDMALWSLSFLLRNWHDKEFRSRWSEFEASIIELILCCYKRDLFFKKIRLSEALRQAYQDIENTGYEPNRVLLADCLDSEDIDPTLAMITVSFSFENLLWRLIEETGKSDEFKYLRPRGKWIEKLKGDKIDETYPIFKRCLDLRDRSVHPWLEKLSPVEREEFIDNLERLFLKKRANSL